MTDDEKRELADVYEKAAEYLEEYGWRQAFGIHGFDRCVMGAFESATWDQADDRIWSRANDFFADVLELRWVSTKHPVAIWNDDPTRTKDEVINTLHALANKLR